MKILAFDPGGATGWARWADGTITSGQFDTVEHHKALWRFLVGECPDVIVCESFEYRNQADVELVSREYIGIIKLYQELRGNGIDADSGHVQLVFQRSAQGVGKNAFWSDNKLVRVGVLTRPLKQNRHANDAKRHLLYWFSFTHGDNRYILELK